MTSQEGARPTSYGAGSQQIVCHDSEAAVLGTGCRRRGEDVKNMTKKPVFQAYFPPRMVCVLPVSISPLLGSCKWKQLLAHAVLAAEIIVENFHGI